MLTRLIVIFVFFGDYAPEDDAMHWHIMAQNILNGRGLIVDEDKMAYRMPLPGLYFATIYAVFAPSVRAVQIGNTFLGVATVWLVYDLVRRIFGVMSARWSALFVSFYPLLLFYTAHLYSETPVIFLIALALWLVWVLRDHTPIAFALVGIVLGLAVLTRQTALPVAVLISLWHLVPCRRGELLRHLSQALILLVFLALTITPWMVRNYLVMGRFVPLSSQAGSSFWIANNPLADGTGVEDESKILRVPQVDALSETERGAAYQKLAIQFIRENPLRFAELTLYRLRYFWHLGYHGEGPAEVVFLVIYVPLLGLAAMGIWKGWRLDRNAVLLLLTVPLALTAVHMVFLPVGRYRLPAELILCIFAGVGLPWNFTLGEEANRKGKVAEIAAR
jgi:4-amino-4-deoxy-L-arabinose transferase-like glycosyltransferase